MRRLPDSPDPHDLTSGGPPAPPLGWRSRVRADIAGVALTLGALGWKLVEGPVPQWIERFLAHDAIRLLRAVIELVIDLTVPLGFTLAALALLVLGFYVRERRRFFSRKKNDPRPTERSDTIARWYKKGVAMGASHMIIVEGANIVTDDPAGDEQPVYLTAGQQLDAKELGIGRGSAEVVDYFDLRIPLESQLSWGIRKAAKLLELEWND